MDLLIEIFGVLWSHFTGDGPLHTLSNAVHMAFVPVATLYGIEQICVAAEAGIPLEYR